MKSLTLALLFVFSVSTFAQTGFHKNPIIYQALDPEAVAPGGPDLTLRVMGNGFDFESVVYWNNVPLATTVLGTRFVSAVVPAAFTATPQTAWIRVHNPKPYGGFSNTVFFHVATPKSVATFSTSGIATTNSHNFGDIFPNDIATGDFNGDGKLDFLLTNGPGLLESELLLNNGAGGYVPSLVRTCPVQRGGAVTADFNRDGNTDIAVACTDRISVLMGKGDGTFHSHQDYLVTAPTSLRVADINQDGKLDLVFISNSNTVSILLGNGDGTFQTTPLTVFTGDLGGSTNLVIGDFNRDGKLDIASTQQINSILVALGNGDGTFQPPQTFFAPLNITLPIKLVTADFSNRGVLDLAVLFGADATGGNASTVVMFRGAGNGSFNNSRSFTVCCSPTVYDMVAGDFNSDGILDLAVIGQIFPSSGAVPVLTVLSGDGDGTFSMETGNLIPAGGGGNSYKLVEGDLNGNGRLDLVFMAGDFFGHEIFALTQ